LDLKNSEGFHSVTASGSTVPTPKMTTERKKALEKTRVCESSIDVSLAYKCENENKTKRAPSKETPMKMSNVPKRES
jgi:hypothetical protein